MDPTTREVIKHFGVKDVNVLFGAAMRFMTRGGAVFISDKRRIDDRLTIEFKIVSPENKPASRRQWRRQKAGYIFTIMIQEGGRVVFDASSWWPKNIDGKKRGWLKTFHEGLWINRLRRAESSMNYWLAVYAEVFRKGLGLLSEQTEATEPLPSEMKYFPTEVVHRVFESEQIEVRGYGMRKSPQDEKVQYKAVKVLHKGQEVYETSYRYDPSASELPDRPKITTQFVAGDWEKTLQDLA